MFWTEFFFRQQGVFLVTSQYILKLSHVAPKRTLGKLTGQISGRSTSEKRKSRENSRQTSIEFSLNLSHQTR